MKLIIEIDEDYYELIKHDVNNGMDYLPCKLIANGKPLEEELHREKEQAYYIGYEDGSKSEWTALAEVRNKS